jgi:hypothetical protein
MAGLSQPDGSLAEYGAIACPKAKEINEAEDRMPKPKEWWELTERTRKRKKLGTKFIFATDHNLMVHCPRYIQHLKLANRLPKFTKRDKKRQPKKAKVVCKACLATNDLIGWTDADEKLWWKYGVVRCTAVSGRFVKIMEGIPPKCAYQMEMLVFKHV